MELNDLGLEGKEKERGGGAREKKRGLTKRNCYLLSVIELFLISFNAFH